MNIEKRLSELTGIEKFEVLDINRTKDDKCFHYRCLYDNGGAIISDNYIIYLTESILNAYDRFSMKDYNNGFLKFQSNLLKNIFFSYEDDKRWNIYLYILYDNDEILKGIPVEKIEMDDNFALKSFANISTDNEIVSLLSKKWLPKIIPQISELSDETDIASVWESELSKLGLAGFLEDKRISENDITDYIEKKKEKIINKSIISNSNSNEYTLLNKFERIHSLSFTGFRKFCFGEKEMKLNPKSVNILYGLNGSGKTSTLEAISAAFTGYCTEDGKATVESADGTILSSQENYASTYGKAWYNTPMVRSSQLNKKFKIFNYFDSDRPYTFARSADEDYNELLSSLFYDEETIKKQKIIKKLIEKFKYAVKPYESNIKKLKNENNALIIRKEELQKTINLSEASTELMSAIKSTGYNAINTDIIDTVATNAIVAAQSNIELIKQLKPYLTKYEYVSYDNIKAELDSNQEEVKTLLTFQQQYNSLINGKANLGKRLNEVKDYLKNIDSSKQEVMHLQSLCAKFNLKSLSEIVIVELQKKYNERLLAISEAKKVYEKCVNFTDYTLLRISECKSYETQLEKLIADLDSAAKNKAELQKQVNEVEKDNEYLGSLKSNINEMGIKLVADRKITVCPLCGHKYDSMELLLQAMKDNASSLERSVNNSYTEKKQNLLKLKSDITSINEKISTVKDELKYIDLVVQIRDLLKKVGFTCNIDTFADLNINFDDQLRQIKEQEQAAKELSILFNSINRSIIFLKYKNQTKEISIMDFQIYLDKELKDGDKQITDIVDNIGQYDNKIKQIEEKITAAGIGDITEHRDHLINESEILKQALNTLDATKKKFDLSPIDDLSKWVNKLDNLKKELKVYKEILSENSEILSIDKKLTDYKEEYDRNEQYRDRCQKAYTLLSDLPDISRYATEFVNKNKDSINKLFSLIHRPKEFSSVDFSENGIPIVKRKGDDDAVLPQNMSTGQKTSFALAVMLTLYLSAKSAPHILLLDEPVVNMDEIHFSNLIEILRILVINGTQIFITTESKEILGYLKRKFSFLNEDLHIYEFDRDVEGHTVRINQLFPQE